MLIVLPSYEPSKPYVPPIFEPLPLAKFKQYPFGKSQMERLEDLNPYIYKEYSNDDIITLIEQLRQKACKKFEQDIIGLGINDQTVEYGKLKLKDRITEQQVDMNINALLEESNNSCTLPRCIGISMFVLGVIAFIASGILFLLGSYLLAGILAGGGLGLFIGSLVVILRPTSAEKKLALIGPIDAQTYFTKGPLEEREAQIISLLPPDKSGYDNQKLIRQNIYHFHAQAMQEQHELMKQQDPAKYAQLVAKIFQGKQEDADVLEFRQQITQIFLQKMADNHYND